MKPKEELQLVNFENIASSTLQIRVKLLFENITLSVKNKILRYKGEKLFLFFIRFNGRDVCNLRLVYPDTVEFLSLANSSL